MKSKHEAPKTGRRKAAEDTTNTKTTAKTSKREKSAAEITGEKRSAYNRGESKKPRYAAVKSQKKKPKEKSRRGIAAAVTVFAVLAAVYCAVGAYFSTHFYFGTTVNGCDVSSMAADKAKQAIMQSAEDYVLTLVEQNSVYESISGRNIRLSVSITDEFDNLLAEQKPFLWPLYIFGDKTYTPSESVVSYNYDSDKLTEIIDGLECVNPEYPIEAKDASLILMDGAFQIVAEDDSNIAHRDELEDKIKIAVETQTRQLNLMDENLYDKPSVRADDPEMIAKKEICDSIVDMKIDLVFGYSDECIDAQTIVNWIDVNESGGEYVMAVNKDKVTEYVESLAEKYNTSGKPKQFAATRGEVVEILYGDYGWKLDNDYAVKQLTKYVENKSSVHLDLTDQSEESSAWWEQTAVGYDANGNDYYGTTYAEVSISEQHMWLYQDGVLTLETDVVTGNPNLGNDTPQGAFRIRHKEKDAVLRGPGYVTPVDYWMVFADDVGFHDATWQAEFGGDFYYTNGSHGCVNMPLEMAEKLYDLVYIDMPVFVYY